MSSSSGGKKSKRNRVKNLFKELFQSPSASGSNVQQPGTISSSTIPSPSPSQLNIRQPEIILPSSSVTNLDLPEVGLGIGSRPKEDDAIISPLASQSNTTEVAGSVAPSASPSNIKEGLGIAGRFVQTLLKKLPDCVDGNPVKMTLSIVKTIIDIKDEIGDNKDSLTEGLCSTQRLLSDAIGKVDFHDSDEVQKEMEDYKRKIEEQNTQLLQIAKELESMFRHVDYENYRKKINNVCKDINEITDVFMFRMQVEIRTKTALMHDRMEEEQKARLKKSLLDLKPSAKANHKTAIEGQSLKREICTEGTRVKILGDITSWANDCTKNSPRVFWLTGQAGSGKTTIAYTIAKRFEIGQHTILGANFLCSRQFDETRSLNRILPTIAYQLAYKCGPYETALHAHVPDKSSVVDHDVSEQMQELLVGPWHKVPRLDNLPTHLIVIDALDEINEEGGSEFLGVLLTTINQQHFIGLKFLVTSRTDPQIADLVRSFSSKAVCRLQDVPIEDAEADVERYLDAKLPNIVGSPELAELRNRASGLFIYAATAVRILTTARSITYKEQMRKLNNLLSKPSGLSSVGKDKSPIDGLYEQILYEAFSDFTDEEDLAPRLRILFTFLCAAERISTSVAATLMDEDDELARAVLNDLHAVLYIQDGRVFWYHASFPDFIFARNRSNYRMGDENCEFWCDQAAQHSLLAASCLRIMNSEVDGLRFNMGNITSSYLLDSEHADELSEQVNKNIGPVMRYSSFHWARHLSLSSLIQNVGHICACISNFLQIRVLFWIEAMNLLGASSHCTNMLHLARQWVLNSKCSAGTKSTLAPNLLESANFATYFTGSPAAESTPHLYISSLATWKQESSLSQNWKSQFSRIPVFTHGDARNNVPLLTIHVPEAEVYAVAFSSDSTRIASGSSDGYVRIWDASTGKEVKTLKGHTDGVRSVAFSSDDKWIASGSYDRTVRVWDVSTGECLRVMNGHTDRVNSVTFPANGLWLVSGSDDKSIRMWDIQTGGIFKVLMGHTGKVNSVAFSGDGAWIVTGSDDCSVRVWDTSTGDELRAMNGHTGVVTSVVISGDAWIASGSRDCSVRVWSAATGAELKVMEGHNDWVYSVAFSGTGAWIASGSSDHSVRVWDAFTGEALKVLQGHSEVVYSVSFSSDATRVVSGSANGSVRVWNVSTSTEIDERKGATISVTSVAFSSDGTRVLFGSSDGSVHVWDATTRQELQVLREGTKKVTSVAISHDGTHIAWGSGGEVWVWNVLRNTEVKVLEGHTDDVRSVSFSSDGSLTVSGSHDCTVRLWDPLKGVELKVMDGHTDWVRSAAFSGDDKQIVSGSDDLSVQVWDVLSGEALVVMTGHSRWVLSVAFSSDAARVVSGSLDKTVRVWDACTGTELKVLHGHTSSVRSVAFSTDDTHIVSGSADHTVRIWDVSTGEEINMLRGGHTDDVNSIAVSGDGKSIISGSRDGSVVVWGMDDPSWYIGEKNWILSPPSKDRLMWALPDAHVLQRSNCHILTGKSNYSFFDFEQCIQVVGLAWQTCYTPSHPAHRI